MATYKITVEKEELNKIVQFLTNTVVPSQVGFNLVQIAQILEKAEEINENKSN